MIRVLIVESSEHVGRVVADRIAHALRERPSLVLGLPTGRTPVAAYAELRRLHTEHELDFSHAATFNLDEFVGLAPQHPASFRRFMQEKLFDGINLPPQRIHFLNGLARDLDDECARYEAAIEAAGGIDLQLLGLGMNGHIGFNEPADELTAITHRTTLLPATRQANAEPFGDASRVPVEGLTMGVGTILGARAILLVATGSQKASCVERTVNGPVTTRVPASLLQLHRDVDIVIDRAAAAALLAAPRTRTIAISKPRSESR